MGKIINSTFVSVDGVINHMDVWHFAYTDDEAQEIAMEQLQASEAMLMGRNTYDVYASAWSGRDGAYADKINSMPKYVASTTLDKAGWNNTTVIKGDLAAEAAELKRRGGDVLMHGFGPVARTLIGNGLLDVLHLWVHPHFAGVGGPGDMLLGEGNSARLELAGTRILKSGVVLLSYQVPATGAGE
ncbi:dihydrofolate reductase family protein [Actinomadura sp. 7K507]|uniref:dihydrofolate reductase family protein n=1 Tax=Actinomadura sp. 7K507 TaxID=2530365 RepID=UPI0010509AA8|nr:dihydrofolate reductase family protein [Actinomadura sp. 7K507]TDC83547.1 dihydrofolate reductase [Actinomadura sp. 7K507]